MNKLRHRLTRLAGIFLFFAVVASLSHAQPIVVRFYSVSGAPLSLEIKGHDVVEIMNIVAAREGELKAFLGQNFKAEVTYLGVPNAINVDISADGKSATVHIPSTGYSTNFNAETSSLLEDKVEDFVRNEGSKEIAELRKTVNATSTAGLSDGNPYATTALTADVFFHDFGLQPGHITSDDDTHRWKFSQRLQGGSWRAEGISGSLYTGELRFDRRLSARNTFTAVLPASYMDTDGAATWGGGLGMAFSHRWLPSNTGSRWAAHSSFFGGSVMRASEQLAAGGAMWTYGMTTAVRHRPNALFSWGLVGQFSGFSGIPMKYDNFQLDGDIDQQIVKLGLPLELKLIGNLTGVAHWTRSFFLRAAAIDDYDTYGGALHWAFGDAKDFRLGYEARSGERFRANLWQAQFGWSF